MFGSEKFFSMILSTCVQMMYIITDMIRQPHILVPWDRSKGKWDGPKWKWDGPREKWDGPRGKWDGPKGNWDGPKDARGQ